MSAFRASPGADANGRMRKHHTKNTVEAPAIIRQDDCWMGTTPAAKYLGTSVPTFRRWIKAGHITPHRTPTGELRFKKAELDGLIN